MRVKGRKYQGDTGDCKSPAYSTPGSIPGRPTKFAYGVMVAQGNSETPRGGVGIKCPERFDSAARC